MADASDSPLSIVIASRDRPALLAKAIPAIRAAIRQGDELIVIDSVSVDPAAVRRAAGAEPVIRCERPGLAVARNMGWQRASHPIVAFVDDDCSPDPSWSEALRRAFDDARIGFVTGQVVPDRETHVALSVLMEQEPQSWTYGDGQRVIGHGANFAVRRDALVAVGGFDELLGVGALLRAAEDTDLFERLLEAGWNGRYVPSARVTHSQWRSGGHALRVYYGYGIGAGALAVKRARTQGTSVVSAAARAFFDALRIAARDVRARYEFGALAQVLWAAGVLRGAATASRLAIVEGRFSPIRGTARR